MVAALSVCVILLQSVTQKAAARPADPAPESSAGGSTVNDGGREFVQGEIIVKLEPEAEQADLNALNRRNDATTVDNLLRSAVNVVGLPQGLSVREAVEIYEDSPDVEYAEPDFLLRPAATPNDPGYDRLWGLNNEGQTGGIPDADVDAPEAWSTTTGDRNNVVAVIDTGTDISHLDLRNNIWINPDEKSGNLRDDDRNGYVDDVNGWDFFNDDNSVYDPADGDEHGTHVSGTIAAEGNNGLGVVGINWRAKVMPLKFIGPDTGSASDAVAAINYAIAENVKISNNSWGGGGYSQALRDAIARADAAGHLFVASAGNGGSDDVGDDNDASPSYPASYDNPNIVSVAATKRDTRLASFSNFGETTVDVGAPGVGILSTLPGNRYGTYSGTSMASPHVAGIAALIRSRDPGLDDAGLKSRILQYSESKESLRGKTVTGGQVNANASLTQTPAPDTIEPSISSVKPAPGSKTRKRTPEIKATAQDTEKNLSKSDVRFFLDGRRVMGFGYNEGTDRLRFVTNKLSFGRHYVKVVATDPAGNSDTRRWSFKVVR
jgi:subtilisin family serine protease